MRKVIVLLSLLAGCSLGPALPMGVPVVNVKCALIVEERSTCNQCTCTVTNPSATAEPTTRGIEVADSPTTTTFDVPVNTSPARRLDDPTTGADGGV